MGGLVVIWFLFLRCWWIDGADDSSCISLKSVGLDVRFGMWVLGYVGVGRLRDEADQASPQSCILDLI